MGVLIFVILLGTICAFIEWLVTDFRDNRARQHQAAQQVMTRAIAVQRASASADRQMAQQVKQTLDQMARIRNQSRW